mmetsp:Transcript_18526/g.47379  ORF Transcript_18526/g.47379 Transcript_18526/m.47379 type:complete len:209 (+) Transcript_18526:1-627(+)
MGFLVEPGAQKLKNHPFFRAWLQPQSSLRGRRERERSRAAQARLRPLRALRAQMGFLVDALQFYLHADVLEPSWRQLSSRIQTSSDFEEVARAHEAYLGSLAVHIFRHVPEVCAALDSVLRSCACLCELLETAEDRAASASLGGNVSDGSYEPAEFEKIQAQFWVQSDFFLEFLRGAHSASPDASPHLAQLLMRIDFNGFWSGGDRYN